jgi:hypothetical protein
METQYFSHDYNAHRDLKLVRLRNKMGFEGIGLFWTFTEYLWENGNRVAYEDLELIADELHADADKLTQLITDFSLFTTEQTEKGSIVYSTSINRRMEERKERQNDLSYKRSIAGKKGMETRWGTDYSAKSITQNSDNKKIATDNNNDFVTNNKEITNDNKKESVINDVITKDNNNDFVMDNKITNDNQNKSKREIENNIIPPIIPQRGKFLNETKIEIENKKIDDGKGDGENDALPTAVDAKPDLPKKPRGGAKFSFEVDARPEWIAENMAQIFKDYVDYRRDMGKAFRSEKQAHVAMMS